MENTILVTGFDPFGGADINPAWEAVRLLPDRIGNVRVEKLRIPTVFGKAADLVLAAARECDPRWILCVGQAGGRAAVTPERIAVNIRDARIPDNQGNQPRGGFVNPEGPAAYFSTLPVMAMADAVCEAGLPGTVSNSAGAFVCNDVLYTLLHAFREGGPGVGFVHVPWLPDQGTPSLPLDQTTAALELCVRTVLSAD